MQSRSQIIFGLEHANDADSDRINDRLQQCNVRICRTDGSTEMTTSIRTRLQLANELKNDLAIDRVEYQYNNQWATAA